MGIEGLELFMLQNREHLGDPRGHRLFWRQEFVRSEGGQLVRGCCRYGLGREFDTRGTVLRVYESMNERVAQK